jgi:hypothetical protein
MTIPERFHAVFDFRAADRLPCIEWATWWNLTTDRWRSEGMAADPGVLGSLFDEFGLDQQRQKWFAPRTAACPKAAYHGAPIVLDAAGYRAILPTLYPQEAFDPVQISRWADERARGKLLFWTSFDGFFWHPRTLMGIENHLLAFYDQPELMKEMNQRVLDFNLRTLDRVCRIAVPDFTTIAEDLSYNHGPMLSPDCFEEFCAPYYRVFVKELLARGIRVFVDSDGDIAPVIPWFKALGVQGILPLERQSGVDVADLQRLHPGFLFLGGYDKRVMKLGEAGMRAEFERLLPAMRAGGFIPSCDHQTPPDVSLENYRIYASLLKEYARLAYSPGLMP